MSSDDHEVEDEGMADKSGGETLKREIAGLRADMLKMFNYLDDRINRLGRALNERDIEHRAFDPPSSPDDHIVETETTSEGKRFTFDDGSLAWECGDGFNMSPSSGLIAAKLSGNLRNWEFCHAYEFCRLRQPGKFPRMSDL